MGKFAYGAKNHTYQRIDAIYRANIYLRYNNEGMMSMVITEPGSESG